jgi:hypothetical protein
VAASLTADIDAEALAARVAILQAAQADELAGRQRTRARLRRWGVRRMPDALDPAGDLEILADRHATTWLREAEAFARQIDPGLVTTGIHVASYQQLGVACPASSGFVYARGLFEVVRHRLPAGAAPGHIVAVGLPAHVATVGKLIDEADEPALIEAVQFSIDATVAHEVAHLAVNDYRGRQIPEGVTYADFVTATAAPAGPGPDRHDREWIRLFAHATHRADLLRPASIWWRIFRDDCRPTCPRWGEALETLTDELSDVATPLVDILRRPAPAAFEEITTR